MGSPTLWFITPAWKRLEVSQLCFEQRAWACDQLAKRGIDANACVIADDGNLDLARRLGMATVDRPNTSLGSKFNVGYEFAAAERIDYVCPIGSDSWVDPKFIADALTGPDAMTPDQHVVAYSRHYAVIRPDGQRRAQLHVAYEGGTTMFYPTAVFAYSGWRPIPEDAQRGCDGHTIAAIRNTGRMKLRVTERHDLETVSFQTELQVTNYDNLIDRWGVGETDKPFANLKRHYPRALVDRMQALYQDRATR